MKRLLMGLIGLMVLTLAGLASAADPLLYMPFTKGANWYCTQGPGGNYSHYKQPTYYSYDWNQGSSLASFANPAYGQNIYAPVQGTVSKVDNWVADGTNNSSGNAANNNGWGNQVIIKDSASGKYVRINHMKQNSATVIVGQFVTIGQYIGKVGWTGFSSSPHVHMQVQNAAEYSDSIPFKFVEGPISCGGWRNSLNFGSSSVLDNDSATNLGHNFSATQVSLNGSWSSYSSGTGFTGANYYTHTVVANDTAKFTWTFTVKSSGWYNIIASWLPNATRDPNTRYVINGSATYFSQQTVDAFGSDNWTTIKYSVYLPAGVTQTVVLSGTTPGKTICADSIILQKLF